MSNDAMRAGGAFDITARLAGAVVAYVVVAVILLSASVVLGLLVLLGVPILVVTLGTVIRPLQAASASSAPRSGKLTALGADTAAGLRVLRGIGGERAFLDRYRDALAAGAAGRRAGGEAAVDARRGAGAAARHLRRLRHVAERALRAVRPDRHRRPRRVLRLRRVPRHPAADRGGGRRQDHALARRRRADAGRPRSSSGTCSSRQLLRPSRPGARRSSTSGRGSSSSPASSRASSRSTPDEAAAIADRLGRFGDDGGVTLGGVPLEELPVDVVRRRIVVSEPDPLLFSGTLRSELDPWGGRGDDDDPRRDLGRERRGRARGAAGRARDARSTSVAGRSRAASGSGSSSPGRCCRRPRCWSSSSRRARSTRTPRRGSRGGCASARAGRTTVVVIDEPARARPGRPRRVPARAAASSPSARHRELLRRARGLPRDGHAGRGRMSELPAHRGRPRAARPGAARSAAGTGAGWCASSACTRSPPGRASPARRCSARLVQSVVDDGTTTSYVDRIVLVLACFVAAADRVHLVRAPRLVRPRRGDVRRAARGLHAAACWRCRSRPSSAPGRATSSPARPRTSTRWPARSASPCRRR